MKMRIKIPKMVFETRRKEWVANRADPTVVVRWVVRLGSLVKIEMCCSWGVDTTVQIGRRRFESYDAWWAKQLYGWLEEDYEMKMGMWSEEGYDETR